MKNEKLTNEEIIKLFKEKHPKLNELIVECLPYGDNKATLVFKNNKHFHIKYDEENSLFIICE